jgi:norsolorinic acid ketoreductase
VAVYLTQPNNTVIATVRDASDDKSKALSELPKDTSSSLIVVTIESTSETSALSAIEELKTKHGISALDLVIANAGIAAVYPRVSEVKPVDMAKHYAVNVIGTVLLFQAVLPLLLKATEPKFVTISSSAGTIINMENLAVPNAAYAPSKTALNWISKKIHVENETIIAFPLDPG